MWAKFSKIFHVVGVVAGTVASAAAAGIIHLPAAAGVAVGATAYLAGALGKALFGDYAETPKP